MDSLLKTVQIP